MRDLCSTSMVSKFCVFNIENNSLYLGLLYSGRIVQANISIKASPSKLNIFLFVFLRHIKYFNSDKIFLDSFFFFPQLRVTSSTKTKCIWRGSLIPNKSVFYCFSMMSALKKKKKKQGRFSKVIIWWALKVIFCLLVSPPMFRLRVQQCYLVWERSLQMKIQHPHFKDFLNNNAVSSFFKAQVFKSKFGWHSVSL